MDFRDVRWQLKQLLRLSPRLTRKRGLGDLQTLLASFDTAQHQRFAELLQRYRLTDWPRLCVAIEYRENLTLLDLLDQHVPRATTNQRGLDIGCRNFSYLPALSAFSAGAWDGVELDAHARYWNGFTRRAYGEWMARQRSNCHYIAGSLLDLHGRYDLVIWLLPFVASRPLELWGLPQRFFQPLQLLRHAHARLQPGGRLFIVNQGEAEAEVQAELFAEAGIEATALGEMRSPFSPFRNQRFGWLVSR